MNTEKLRSIALDDGCSTGLMFVEDGLHAYSIRVVDYTTNIASEVHLTVREMRDLALILTEAVEGRS
jgi:hypothetical protein